MRELAGSPRTEGRDQTPTRTGRRDGLGPETILSAALRAFYERGYHGTSIRDIASGAGMTPASLYHHFSNKQDILSTVMTRIMRDALATTRHELLRAGPSPVEQVSALVRAWIVFHANRRVEARVGASELHCLEREGRQLVVTLRDEQEQMFRSVVARGVEEGVFRTAHPREAARAVVNMGTAVATWFNPDGKLTADDIAVIYVDLALAALEAERPDGNG